LSELEELQTQLAACTVPQRQIALMARIKKLEKEKGIVQPRVHDPAEDRLSKSKKDEFAVEPEPKPERKTGLSPV